MVRAARDHRGVFRAVMRSLWVLALAAACSSPPAEAQLEEIRELFAARDADQIDRRFAEALKTRPAPRDGGGPCAVRFRIANRGQFTDRLVAWTAFPSGDRVQASNVTIARGEPKAALGSASLAVRRQEEQELLQRQGPYAELNGKDLVARATALAREPLPPELLIVILDAAEAKPIDAETFQPGAILARAWLYDQGWACAGKVVATSSESVSVTVDIRRGRDTDHEKVVVNSDLYLNLVNDARSSLKSL